MECQVLPSGESESLQRLAPLVDLYCTLDGPFQNDKITLISWNSQSCPTAFSLRFPTHLQSHTRCCIGYDPELVHAHGTGSQ
jgi:hypothetical protein